MSTPTMENKNHSPAGNDRNFWCTRALVTGYIIISWVLPALVLGWYYCKGLSVVYLGDVFSWWTFWELLAAAFVAILLFAELPTHMRENRAVFPVFGILILVFLFLLWIRVHLLLGSLLICVVAALFVLFDMSVYRKAVEKNAEHKLGGYALYYIDVPILCANMFLLAYFGALKAVAPAHGVETMQPSLIAFRDGAVAFEMLAGNLGIILLRYHPEITSEYTGPWELLRLIHGEYRQRKQQ